jgi:hypothetical protein
MKIFEIRKSNFNATIPLMKITEVIENVEYETVDYNGEHDVCRKSYTLMLDSGTQSTIDDTTKIINITWKIVKNKWTKVETEIAFENFYEWYQSQIAEEC